MTKLEEKLIELRYELSMETYDYFNQKIVKRYSKQFNDGFEHIFVCDGKIVQSSGETNNEMQKDLEELRE